MRQLAALLMRRQDSQLHLSGMILHIYIDAQFGTFTALGFTVYMMCSFNCCCCRRVQK